MTVQNRIKKFIDERGISRYKLWQETKLGRDTAYRLCNDPTYIPTGNVLDKLCATYRVQPGEFLVWIPDDEPVADGINDQQEVPVVEELPKKRHITRKKSAPEAAAKVLPLKKKTA